MTIDDVDEESAGVGDEAGAVDTNAEDLTAVAPRAAPISNFYLGSLVLKPNSPTDYDIYDGLQRITTLAILFSVLRDRIADEARKARLAALVVSASGAPRLVHTGHDTTLATMVQAPGQAIKTGAPRVKGEKILRPRVEYGRRIYDVTRSMVLALENHSQEQLTCLADYLFESVSVCIIETTDSRIARHIFVASNLYGLPLRRDEVLKGQFLALARDEAMEGQIERTWTDLREVVGRESFEDFLIAFDCIWRKRSQGADCLGDLVDHIAQSSNPKELINVLRALKRYAVAWQKLHEYLVRPNGGPLGNHVWRLRFFNWKEWQPLALIWIARYLHDMTDGRNKKQAHIRFAGLHNRCMLMTLYEYDAQQRADRFLRAVKVALEEPKKGARADSNIPFSKNASRLRPLDFSNDVRTRVKNDLLLPILNYEVRRTLLQWYEAHLWPEEMAPGHIAGATVEHVLPDCPDLRSNWMRLFPDAEQRFFMHGSIGNLAMLDYEVNKLAGTMEFVHKQKLFEDKEQYKKYFVLADVKSPIDPNNSNNRTEWNESVITDRTVRMAEHTWRLLDQPEPKVKTTGT